ncbi:hypothetical protein KP509_20G065100 [Ceratopteris richardii]|nr:hypothetical protein KP509_20G065100 [Ceratopteris richardii]
MVTCNKILVYLGDLSRYKELYAVMESSDRDWSVAANYYKQAAVLWPSSGNPYNQLAVLCTYCGNSLSALYLYCRSLAVSVPFETAWENVALLLEKNKQMATQTSTSGSNIDKRLKFDISMPDNLHAFVIEQDLWSIRKAGRCQRDFMISFIELVRILLVQASADELDKAMAVVEEQQGQFLSESIYDTKGNKLAGSIPVALQIVVVLIFCMHHMMRMPTPGVEYLLSITLRFTFKFCTVIAKMARGKSWSAFPMNVILMEWLTDQTESLQRFFVEGDNQTWTIFSVFWEEIIGLDDSFVNELMVDESGFMSQMFQQDQMSEISGKAQWEDHELLGFLPLAGIHVSLDFSSQPPGYADFSLESYSAWNFRATQALQKLFNMIGDNNHGFTLKMPKIAHATPCPEESDPTPSLKEWIEKTFFSPNLSSSLACVRQPEAEAPRNKKVEGTCEDVSSNANALENAGHCELVGSEVSKNNAGSDHEAATEVVFQCKQHSVEQKKDMQLLEEQKMIVNLLEEQKMIVSSTTVAEETQMLNGNSKENDARQQRYEMNHAAKPSNTPIFKLSCETTSFSFRGAGDFHREFLEGEANVSGRLNGPQSIHCFDSVSHVKPKGLKESFSSLSHRDVCIRLNDQLALNTTHSETKNPFVHRLKHLSKQMVAL